MCISWPERAVEIFDGIGFYADKAVKWFSDETVAQVLELLPEAYRNCIQRPVVLNETERMIALLVMGVDGLSGSQSLLLRVTEETNYTSGLRRCLRLRVVEHGRISGGSLISYGYGADDEEDLLRPDHVDGILDELVLKLKMLPKFTAPSGFPD